MLVDGVVGVPRTLTVAFDFCNIARRTASGIARLLQRITRG